MTEIVSLEGREAASWAHVERVMQQHFHEPDLQGARAVFAAIAAHRLAGQPVWPMIVAPPGSGKTETLDALQGLPEVHFIDSVTANTFISGQILQNGKERSPSLLKRLGKSGILICADFSTVLGMPPDKRTTVLADLRRIFDGHLRKEFGTSEGAQEWSGRITLAVATTPDVDRHWAIFQSLGERFVMVRWHRPDGRQAAIRAMNQDVQGAKHELREAVHGLLAALPDGDVAVSAADQGRLAALAEFAVRARTHVARDRQKHVIYQPEAEGPTRLAQQLCQLVKGSALIGGRTTVEAEDMDLAYRVAFDCIPPFRRLVLEGCINTEQGEQPQPKALAIREATLSYVRQDLSLVGLLDQTTLSELALGLLREVGILDPLHQISPPNELEKKVPQQNLWVIEPIGGWLGREDALWKLVENA